MAVEDVVLDSAGFVFDADQNGATDLAGTGFFVWIEEGEHAFIYFVTAAHVVWPERRQRGAKFPPDGDVIIRFNKDGGGVKEIRLPRSEWIYHPDYRWVDLCAVWLDDHKHKLTQDGDACILGIRRIGVSAYDQSKPENRLMHGDEVFITGAFWAHLGEKRNIPIVRTGNIAALPTEPIAFFSPRAPAYLIETRSLGGISGSPVFFDPETRHGRSGRTAGPFTTIDSKTGKTSRPITLMPQRLVGMVLGTWHSDSDKDMIERPASDEKASDALWNSGISVVIPDSQILDFLDSDPMKKHREEAIGQQEALRGAVETSAHTTRSQADDDLHPEGKERFTALLGAAAKTKKQGD